VDPTRDHGAMLGDPAATRTAVVIDSLATLVHHRI